MIREPATGLTPGRRPSLLFARRGGRGASTILFFHSPTCPECAYIKDVFLPRWRKKATQNLVIKDYDLTSLANYGKLLSLEKQLGRKIDKTPPLIVVGRTVLQGRRAIVEGLDQAIKSAQNNTPIDMPHTPNPSTQTPLRNLGLLAVVAGGLVDGINPCAFTTLIFLLSCLALAGRKRRQLAVSGAVFTAGVFIAYFLVGLGLLELIGRARFLAGAGRTLRWAAAGAAGILGLVSLYDYVQIRRGKVGEVKLQLGEGLKKKIHGVIRVRAGRKFHPAAGFAAGFLVALLEFPCTGQVYFPIVVALREIPALRTRAAGYLLLYNLLFILPMLAVFGLALWGVTSAQLAAAMRRHLGRTKLVMAAVFLGLGAVLAAMGR